MRKAIQVKMAILIIIYKVEKGEQINVNNSQQNRLPDKIIKYFYYNTYYHN